MSEPVPPQIELRRRIHLTRLIGEGGMGRVHDGFAPDLGHYVAVKILRAEYADDAEVRARFEEEVALLAQIDHPVRWHESMEKLVADGFDIFIEVGHGNVLSGLIKRLAGDATILSAGTPEDVEKCVQALSS